MTKRATHELAGQGMSKEKKEERGEGREGQNEVRDKTKIRWVDTGLGEDA